MDSFTAGNKPYGENTAIIDKFTLHIREDGSVFHYEHITTFLRLSQQLFISSQSTTHFIKALSLGIRNMCLKLYLEACLAFNKGTRAS